MRVGVTFNVKTGSVMVDVPVPVIASVAVTAVVGVTVGSVPVTGSVAVSATAGVGVGVISGRAGSKTSAGRGSPPLISHVTSRCTWMFCVPGRIGTADCMTASRITGIGNWLDSLMLSTLPTVAPASRASRVALCAASAHASSRAWSTIAAGSLISKRMPSTRLPPTATARSSRLPTREMSVMRTSTMFVAV